VYITSALITTFLRQGDLVQQRDERADLVAVAGHVQLGNRDGVGGEHHAQTVPGTDLAVSSAPLGLTVHGHRDQLAGVVVQVAELRGPIAGVGRVDLGGVHLFQHPAHGVRVRRLIQAGPRVPACIDAGKHMLGNRADPVPDRGERRRAADHSGLHQRQDHHHRVTASPPITRISDLRPHLAQINNLPLGPRPLTSGQSGNGSDLETPSACANRIASPP
jgi:hypothetical protein